MLARACHSAGRSAIEFAGNRVDGPPFLAPAFDYISQVKEFRPRDLPTFLTDDAKLLLVRRLVKEGLLYIPLTGTASSTGT